MDSASRGISVDGKRSADETHSTSTRRGAAFRVLTRVATVPLAAVQRWPLFVGALLLAALSAFANLSPWGFPSFVAADGIGGADVEVVVVEGVAHTQEEYYVRSAPPFYELSQVTESVLSEQRSADAALVTVPWTPVLPEGLSAHGVRSYVVETGDNLGKIAQYYGISTLALAYSNNIVDPDSILPGDKLRIPPIEGVLHVIKKNETLNGIAKKYKAETEKILAYNGLPADGSVLNVGDELVVPGGAPPPPPKPAVSSSSYSGPAYARSTVPLGYYIAPTTGHNYGRRHSNNGVDIANSCGTPIYAAAAGVVNRSDASGWNGGYGKVIEITHPNGTETLYAHNTRNMVGAGVSVAQGQLIALMGTTGRSTGCHLHFEVHGAKNPLVR